jgi:hypothetical protein
MKFKRARLPRYSGGAANQEKFAWFAALNRSTVSACQPFCAREALCHYIVAIDAPSADTIRVFVLKTRTSLLMNRGMAGMDTENFFEEYFDDAMRIHAICAEVGLCDKEAKLLTYMHIKGLKSGKGPAYFRYEQEHDIDAIEILLGETKLLVQTVRDDQDGREEERGKSSMLLAKLSRRISKLDERFTREYGVEMPLSSELRARLRLYRDVAFREEKIALYQAHVAGRLKEYDRERVRKAFRKYRARKVREERDLMQALEGINL